MPQYTFVRRRKVTQIQSDTIEAPDEVTAVAKMNELQTKGEANDSNEWIDLPDTVEYPQLDETAILEVQVSDNEVPSLRAAVVEANGWAKLVGKTIHVTAKMGTLYNDFTGTLVGVVYPPHEPPYAEVRDLEDNVWSVDFNEMKVSEDE